MTAEENQKKIQSEEQQKTVLDLTEAWKKIYFETESAFAKAVEEYVATDSFSEILEDFGRQYMAMYKATSQNVDRFFDNHPLPTKKDIARVCELVVDVEEKVDQLESDFNNNMTALASSLIRLVDFQAVLKDEMLAIRKEMSSLQKQLMQMQDKPTAEAKALAADKTGEMLTVPTGQGQMVEAQEPIKPPAPKAARPRTREPKPKQQK